MYNLLYYYKNNICYFISAVRRLIAYKIIKKVFYNICVCSVYIYYVYINTHTYSIYFKNIYMYLFIFIFI